MKKYIIIGVATIALLFSSCSLDTTSSVDIGSEQALATIETLNMSMLGVNTAMLSYKPLTWNQQDISGVFRFMVENDMAAGYISRVGFGTHWQDEWNFAGHVYGNRTINGFEAPWLICYNMIRRVNEIIQAAEAMKPEESDMELYHDILGQAHGIRAFMHHTLNYHYSTRYTAEAAPTALSVPIRTKPTNESMARNTALEVHTFVIEEYQLSIDYFTKGSGTSDYSLMSLYAVKLLKSRAHFYAQEYDKALEGALDVINNSGKSIMGPEHYNAGFVNGNGNPEWIWGGVFDSGYIPGWTSYRRWVGYDFAGPENNNRPNLVDLSYLLGMNNEDLEPEESYEGGLPDTKGHTMSLNDTRSKLILTDTPEVIAANLAKDPQYYRSFLSTDNSIVYQGRIRKFGTVNSTQGLGDIPFVRLAEAYYIAAECEWVNGNYAAAGTYLATTVLPYDPAFVAQTGDDLMMQIANYKVIDMWGEGRGMEDVKRRGNWVYRINKYQDKLSTATHQYRSISPFTPSNVPKPAINDLLTMIIPQSAMNSDPLLEQNPM